VWEKIEKEGRGTEGEDGFGLGKDWRFVEADSFNLAEGAQVPDKSHSSEAVLTGIKDQTQARTSVRFSPTSAELCICAWSGAQTIYIRNTLTHTVGLVLKPIVC
jgi:hypothetical protein